MEESKMSLLIEFLDQLEYDQFVATKLEEGERVVRYKRAQELLAQIDKRL